MLWESAPFGGSEARSYFFSVWRGLLSVAPVRRDQLDAALTQPFSKRIAVVGLVGDHALKTSTGTTWTETADPDRLEGNFREFDLRCF